MVGVISSTDVQGQRDMRFVPVTISWLAVSSSSCVPTGNGIAATAHNDVMRNSVRVQIYLAIECGSAKKIAVGDLKFVNRKNFASMEKDK